MSRYRTSKKVVGYGYVGRWIDGTLGWNLPGFLSGGPRSESWTTWNESAVGEMGVRCKITIEVAPGKGGKLVRRRFKGEKR